MKFPARFVIAVLCLLFVFPLPALSQSDNCPVLVQQALQSLGELCTGTARNEACYGNRLIDVALREGAGGLSFARPGDIAPLEHIRSFSLSAMTQPEEWGVALLLLQANLPETLPGQNVTMILVGDVLVEDASDSVVTFEVTSSGNINVRSGPGTGNSVLTTLSAGQVVVADGRNAAGDWLRILLEDGSTGWVSASLVSVEGDLSALAEVDSRTDAAGARYGPMQAFYFRAGIGEQQCAEAPPDGILLQTPAGAQRVNLLVNEVSIELGSTVFLRAVPGDSMSVAVVEGSASVTAEGRTVNAVEGTQAVVPLDEAGIASGQPELRPYDIDELAALVGLITVMPEQVDIAGPLTEEEITLLLRGSLVASDYEGDICAEESVTFTHTLNPAPTVDPETVVTTGGMGRVFTVRAGTTVTFTAGGDTQLRRGHAYYLILMEPLGSFFADHFHRSTSPTLTYTFDEDRDFSVSVAGGAGDTITLTISCGG